MTGHREPGVRARPDWSFVRSGGPGCRWEGPELTFLGSAIGGIHPPAYPWLIALKALAGALQEVSGPRFALGDRDLLLQLAVDARAEGDRRRAEILADMIRFPPFSYAERVVAVGTLSRALGRKSGFNPRISYDVALPPRLSFAFNPWHRPAGSPDGTGGEFTSREGATTVALTRREREENLQRMKEAIARRPDLPAAVREAAIEIFDVEGRGAIDDSNGATAGITRKTLEDAQRAKVAGLNGVRSPSELTHAQIISVYAWYVDKVMVDGGGAWRLDEFADRRTAIALAGTFIAHGWTGGGKMLFDAAERLLGNLDQEQRNRFGLPSHVGDVGAALRVLETLSNSGRAQAVRTAIADQRRIWLERRKEAIRQNANYSDAEKRRRLNLLTGWPKRIARFE
jgi:hypothetical protein